MAFNYYLGFNLLEDRMSEECPYYSMLPYDAAQLSRYVSVWWTDL